jgi:hypothetical protein
MANQEKRGKPRARFTAPDEEVFEVTNAHAKDRLWIAGLLGSALNVENEWDESHHPRGVGSLGDLFDGVAHKTGEHVTLLV